MTNSPAVYDIPGGYEVELQVVNMLAGMRPEDKELLLRLTMIVPLFAHIVRIVGEDRDLDGLVRVCDVIRRAL